MTNGFRLGRIAGIQIFADWSVVVIVFLVTFSLGAGVFRLWHPEWSPALSMGVAFLAALLLLVSVLTHELSHALVGRRSGMQINRITLFIFGGLAHLEHEPDKWTTELKMAIAGPITSLLLGGAFLLLAALFAPTVSAVEAMDPLAILAAMGPTVTLFTWLGQINIILALFNLVPGFPLDGGRVLRAALWGATGDLRRATRYAAGAGRLFAAVLLAAGFAMMLGIRVPFVGTGFVGGLWLVLIGWFLHNAAVLSYRQLLVRDSLEHIPVARVMRENVITVPDSLSVQKLVDAHLLPGEQRAFPVMGDDRFIGIVCLKDVRKVAREAWPHTPVREIMTPANSIEMVQPAGNAADAMVALGRRGVNQLPVVENGRVRGLVAREDLLKLLSLYGDPALTS